METSMGKNGSLSKRKHGVADDRLSSLSDELIHLVMSFLTTKQAVQTCVLSKRWLFLWKSLPFIYFNANSYKFRYVEDEDDKADEYDKYIEAKNRSFSNFISQMLLRRRPTNLVKVRFKCSRFTIDSLLVESLICYALEHKVEELEGTEGYNIKKLESVEDEYVEGTEGYNIKKLHLPALQSLKLVRFTLVDQKLSLPALQSLHLDSLTAMDQDFYPRLFSSCPNLQTLKLVSCYFKDLESLSICAPNLKNFEMSFLPYGLFYRYGFKVVIDAPKLKTFKFTGSCGAPMLFLVENQFASLDELYFDWKYNEEDFTYKQEDYLGLVNTFQQFTCAKSMSLSLQTIKALFEIPTLLKGSQLEFANLKFLKLIVDHESDFFIPTSVLNRYAAQSSEDAKCWLPICCDNCWA